CPAVTEQRHAHEHGLPFRVADKLPGRARRTTPAGVEHANLARDTEPTSLRGARYVADRSRIVDGHPWQVLGALFLLAFAGGLAGLYSLRWELVTPTGLRERLPRLEIGTTVMAVVAWLTVITGTWIVYPWYRAATPTSPQSMLLADPARALWQTFG